MSVVLNVHVTKTCLHTFIRPRDRQWNLKFLLLIYLSKSIYLIDNFPSLFYMFSPRM